MEITLDLFGVHILIVLIVFILFITRLFLPRRYKNARKKILIANSLVVLISFSIALVSYWPHEFEKKYLEKSLSKKTDNRPLRVLADSIDFYIGIATNPNSIYLERIGKEFNSMVGENDFKPGRLLKDPSNWEFDFSDADRLLDFAASNKMRMRGHTLIWGKFSGMTHPKEWDI